LCDGHVADLKRDLSGIFHTFVLWKKKEKKEKQDEQRGKRKE
jgi:hypothetical protein